MRVVLDTDVLVRATKYANGPARELLGLLQSDPHILVISREILVELVRVLDYPRLCQQHHLLHATVRAYCANFGIRVLRDNELLAEIRQSASDDNGA
ncbi:MAG TPA: PIN domain-containing protein [Pirellulales bacterium]|nr:PIN domain-containing protein [Pirellulales bacterium]